jgi:hypothetical protein
MNKRYLWVVEFFSNGEWIAQLNVHESRKDARSEADFLRCGGEKVRVCKYVPEDK